MTPRLNTLVAIAAIAAGAGCAPGLKPSPATPAPAAAVAQAPRPVAPVPAPDTTVTTPALRTPADVAVTRTEVARQALAVFGDSLPPAVPTAIDETPTGGGDLAAADSAEGDDAEASPMWDIDVRSFEGHDRVARYVQLFAGSAREQFARRLQRGTRYDAMIRAKLRAGGIPEDMTYLALIESGYDPHAYSRAAAVGMWQFMTATARGMRLRVDWWVDERRDPVRSTDAAVKFLDILRQQFGSLYLAAAAYNGGPGRVSRGLTRFADDLEGTTGDSLFFALAEEDYLPKETKNYVPQLIAAAIVGKEPERYGISITPQPEYVYDTVAVPGGTPLLAVAKASDTTVAAIVDLNPHLLRGATPPGGRFVVRVPVGTAGAFARRFAALDAADREGFRKATTKKETLAQLAARVGVSTRAISTFNPRGFRRRKNGTLVAGQTVLVPSAAVLAAARNVPDPSVERYGSSSRASRGTPARTHVVRAGDNLSTIAKRYGTTTSALMRMNGLKRALIVPGQELVVRSASRGARAGTRIASAARDDDRPSEAKPSRTARGKRPAASASSREARRSSGKGRSAKGATKAATKGGRSARSAKAATTSSKSRSKAVAKSSASAKGKTTAKAAKPATRKGTAKAASTSGAKGGKARKKETT